MPKVLEIPKAFTPTGGYGTEMPAPVLADCTDALAINVPDLRGLWRSIDVRVNDVIEVNGSVEIVFTDWSIPDPSISEIIVVDRGLLEFLLRFKR